MDSKMIDKPMRPANRLGLDYAAEARKMPAPCRIIDVHTHLQGTLAARLYARVAEDFGIQLTYSMTPTELLDDVRRELAGQVRFIAVPNHQAPDLRHAVTDGFLEQIETFHRQGERIVKLWAAPRGRDIGGAIGVPDAFAFDSSHYREAARLTAQLEMLFMVHVGDPDTWFATKYSDASKYGTKLDQYVPFRKALDTYDVPFIAAHMGGWPEDLGFLSGLLDRHPNLYLDTSATKWMVRELSRHPREALVEFLEQWRGRILFGSDIVANDVHVAGDKFEEAYDLYASRYWALRTLWESKYEGESPIADPDLHLTDPEKYGELDAPTLVGKHLPRELRDSLYFEAAEALLEPYYAGHATEVVESRQ